MEKNRYRVDPVEKTRNLETDFRSKYKETPKKENKKEEGKTFLELLAKKHREKNGDEPR